MLQANHIKGLKPILFIHIPLYSIPTKYIYKWVFMPISEIYILSRNTVYYSNVYVIFVWRQINDYYLFIYLLRRVNLPGVSYPGESFVKMCVEIFSGYDTPASLSPRGIILGRVNLPGVSYPGSQWKELSIRSSKFNTSFTSIYFQVGTVQTDFQNLPNSIKTCWILTIKKMSL